MTRDELIHRLIEKCHEKGLRFLAFQAYTGIYLVIAHDGKKAGKKPSMENCRDSQDYELIKKAWIKAGEIVLAADTDPIGALGLATDYLDTL